MYVKICMYTETKSFSALLPQETAIKELNWVPL